MEEVPFSCCYCQLLSVAEKLIFSPCWKLLLCLDFHCFCYYIYIMACFRGRCPSAWKWKYYFLSYVWLYMTLGTSSPPGSSVHRILQARILEWVAISFSRESSWPRDWTRISCIKGRFFLPSNHQGSPTPLPECKLECLCSALREIIWPFPSMNTYSQKKRLTHTFQRLAIPRDILEDWRPFHFTSPLPLPPFHFTSHYLSLSILLLNSVPHWFSLADCIKEPGIQTWQDDFSETPVCHLFS